MNQFHDLLLWQEASRKDIERAFGNLQCQWQWVSNPIHLHQLNDIALRLASCIILHNMIVSDRVIGDINSTYNPAFTVMYDIEPNTVETNAVQNISEYTSTTGLGMLNEANHNLICNEWKDYHHLYLIIVHHYLYLIIHHDYC